MIKRRLVGNIFMEMSSDFQSTSLCLLPLLDQGHNYWLCKISNNMIYFNFIFATVALIGDLNGLFTIFYRAIFIFLLAIVGVFYPYNRGALFTALVVIYALTSGIAGYRATSFYLQLEGTNWVKLNIPC